MQNTERTVYVECDYDVPTTEVPTDAEIIDTVKKIDETEDVVILRTTYLMPCLQLKIQLRRNVLIP